MNTLREAGEFVGIPAGAAQVAFAPPGGSTITLDAVSQLIGLDDPKDRPRSLSAVIHALQNLPTFTLDAELLSGTQGEDPYDLRIRLSPSVAITWHTTVSISQEGGARPVSTERVSNAGGDLSITTLEAGPAYEVAVGRSGVGSAGMAVLTKSLGQIQVRFKPVPSSPQPPPPPSPPPVTLSVAYGDQSSQSFQMIVLSGAGFQGGQDPELVDFLEVDSESKKEALVATEQADSVGRASVTFSVDVATPRVTHTYIARGQTSGRTSNEAGVDV